MPTDEVISYQFDFHYNGDSIEYQDYSIEGTLSSEGIIQVNSLENKLSVAWAGQTPLADSGILIKLRFKALECGIIKNILTNFLANTDTVKNIINGIIIVSPDYVYGDIDDNDYIQAFDAALALQYSVGLDPLPDIDPLPWEDWRSAAANVDGHENISAYDASLILQYTVRLIDSFPVQSYKNSTSVPQADVSVKAENGCIDFHSSGELKGLNITIEGNTELFGIPQTFNSNILLATNISSSGYSVGLATAYSPAEDEIILRIPVTGTPDQPVILNLMVNNKEKQISLYQPVSASEIPYSTIEMYPNPANTTLYFRDLAGETSISIYDLQGWKVISKTITNAQIDISDLPNGLYTIHITDRNKTLIKKLIKQ